MDLPDLPSLSLVPLASGNKYEQRAEGGFAPGSGGRNPEFLNETVRRRILLYVQAGANWSVAMRGVGVTRTRIYAWRKKAEEGIEPYATFWEEIEEAEAQCEMRLIAGWAQAAQTDWRAGAAFLSVRFRERWNANAPGEEGIESDDLVEPRDDIQHLSETMAAYEEAGITPARVIEADG